MTFYPGQLVVCVDDRTTPDLGIGPSDPSRWTDTGFHLLRRGTIYTIRSVGTCPDFGLVEVWLCEITRPLSHYGREPGYYAIRFRPLDDSKIKIFRSMLTKAPEREDA